MAQKGGSVLLLLFGLVFLGVGAGAGYFSARVLARAEAMRKWVETPATVLACDLVVSRGSEGGATYAVKAAYRYQVNGVSYSCDRVSLHAGSDNIGRFHRRVYADLKRRLASGVTIPCRYNPENPSEAILFWRPRLELLLVMQLFALAFGGAGLAVVLTGLRALLASSERALSPLAQGQIRMRGASSHRTAGALALFWNAYAGWFLWQTCRVMSPEPLPWWLWLIALTGVIPAGVAGYLIGRFRKFGVSVFEMAPLPGVLGGPVNGTVRIPARVGEEAGCELTLQCLHRYTSGSGKQRTTHTDVVWEGSNRLDGGHVYGEETMLPVRFSVPYDCPATTAAGGCNGYYWQLRVTAAAPGIDYKAVFDVPVRRTAQSSPDRAPPVAPSQGASLEPAEQVALREGLRLEARPQGGVELIFPACRQRSAAVFLSLFSLAWTAVCVALWTVAKGPAGIAALFTLVDGILLLTLFNLVFLRRGIAVDRAGRACVTWWDAPGIPKRERRVAFDEILEIRSERASQSGNHVYYRIVLATRSGAPITVGSGLRSWHDAEGMAALLRGALEPAFVLQGFCV